MDELYIKMIANTKKLKDDGDKILKPLSSQQVEKLIQIFEHYYKSHDIVANNFNEFSDFLKNNSIDIVNSFARTMAETE